MRTWIFQGNPDDYDIDGYLASRPPQVVWLVTRYTGEMGIGDRIYFWRNQGKQNAIAGIIAEGIMIEPPTIREEDPEGVKFWRELGPRATSPQVRSVMRLVKVANAREVIRSDWCNEDPVLRGLPNLRMRAGTNYAVAPEQAARLAAVWSRTGQDWTRNESVAGLWAYAKTYGQSVSKLPGSPVADVAITIGRAVSGVYAKVMNFRSIDPRAPGTGMTGAGEADRAVWREFYDPTSSTLRVNDIDKEFGRVWGTIQNQGHVPQPEANATAAVIVQEAERLERLALGDLTTKYLAQVAKDSERPLTRLVTQRAYERNPLVIAIGRTRAAYKCEVPDCGHELFTASDGHPYTEVHHIIPLAEGGEDTIENVACLCPAHHREIHLGVKATALAEALKNLRKG